MAKYDQGEIVTYYFVIKHDESGGKEIQGWTDNKKLAEFYLEFHKCKRFKLKKYTTTIEQIGKICEENLHDEIKIYNFITRKEGKHNETDTVMIPATYTEVQFVREECNTFLSTFILYSYLNEAIPYLKSKYQRALKDIFLLDIIDQVINNRGGKITQILEFDQVLVLLESFPENFGQ